jgi:hypothetical protein
MYLLLFNKSKKFYYFKKDNLMNLYLIKFQT